MSDVAENKVLPEEPARKRKREDSTKKKKSKRAKTTSNAPSPPPVQEEVKCEKSLQAQRWDEAAESELNIESELDRNGWPHLDPSTLFDATKMAHKPDVANALPRAVAKKLNSPYYTEIRDDIDNGKIQYVERKIGEKMKFVLRHADRPNRPVTFVTPLMYVTHADFHSYDSTHQIKKNKRKFVVSECPVSHPQEQAPPGAVHSAETRTRNVAVVDFFDNVLKKIPNIVGMARALEGSELEGPRGTVRDILSARAEALGQETPDPVTAEAVVERANKENKLRSDIFMMRHPDDEKDKPPGIPPNKLRFAGFSSRGFWEVKPVEGKNGAAAKYPECKRLFVRNHPVFKKIYDEEHWEYNEMPIIVFDKNTKAMVTTDPFKFHYPDEGQERSIVKGDVVFFQGELLFNNDPAGGGRATFDIKRVFKQGFNIKGAEGTLEINTDLSTLDDDLFDMLPDAEEEVVGAIAYREASSNSLVVHGDANGEVLD